METQVAVSPVAAPFEAVVAPYYDGLMRRWPSSWGMPRKRGT
jgi:hypothetical protein